MNANTNTNHHAQNTETHVKSGGSSLFPEQIHRIFPCLPYSFCFWPQPPPFLCYNLSVRMFRYSIYKIYKNCRFLSQIFDA